jgi:hypothetical protein
MAQRTDFTEIKIIDGRFMEAVRRGDRQLISVHAINPKFAPDFNVFAANVAYELRHRLYYRSDGGKNARGLVRATGDLAVLHKLFSTNSPPPKPGAPIRLNAVFIRRKDARAHMQWVMAIRFNNTSDFKFVDADEEPIATDKASSVQEKMMKLYLAHAHGVAGKMHGPPGIRIRKLLDVADRVGFPRNWDLWIYYSGAVYQFMDWRIQLDDEETNPNSPRRKMTAATGGRTPFTGSAGPGVDWQTFPIRAMLLACSKHQGIEDCDATMHNHLKQAEAEIEKTFDAVIQRTNEVQSMTPSVNPFDTTPSGALLGPMAFRFHKHLVALTKDKDSLYSIWS